MSAHKMFPCHPERSRTAESNRSGCPRRRAGTRKGGISAILLPGSLIRSRANARSRYSSSSTAGFRPPLRMTCLRPCTQNKSILSFFALPYTSARFITVLPFLFMASAYLYAPPTGYFIYVIAYSDFFIIHSLRNAIAYFGWLFSIPSKTIVSE